MSAFWDQRFAEPGYKYGTEPNAFLRELGKTLPKPRAAIVVSPHWMTRGFPVKQADRYQAWHDFGGFPAELYRLQYAPAGDAALAERVQAAIAKAGLPTASDANPQIDHGVWVPLMLMWPEADVPIVQVSTSTGDAAAHWALGEALRPLLDADDELLLIGSGSFEFLYILLQAALGEASHYNVGDLWHGAMYTLMGLGALLLTATHFEFTYSRRDLSLADTTQRFFTKLFEDGYIHQEDIELWYSDRKSVV